MRNLLLAALAVACFIGVGLNGVRADDDCAAVIDKAIKASGGFDKLSKIKAEIMKSKGKVSVMGLEIPFTSEHYVFTPDKMKMKIEGEVMGQKFEFVMVANGKKGWRSAMGQTMDMDDGQIAEHAETMHVHMVSSLVCLKDKAYSLSPLGESKVDDKAAVGVKVTFKGRRDVNLFFDKDSGLLLKTANRAKDDMGGGEFNQEMIFTDYKDKDGFKVATKMKITRDGAAFLEQEILEHKMLEKIDENEFAKP